MSQLRNLLVLVVYVLGAHVLPMAHPVLHHHPQSLAADSIVAADCVAVGDCQQKAGGHCCAGHHHRPAAAAESEPATSAADGACVAADTGCAHRCGETCALRLAGHSPVGAGVAAGGQPQERLFGGIRVAIESSRAVPGRRGELPEQRGPPAACMVQLAAA